MSVVAAIAAESDLVGVRPSLRISEPESSPARRRVSSRAKVRANRRNGRRGTGPRTCASKDRARRNALVHGAYSNDLLLPGEDAALLEDQRRQFVAAWEPGDACELLLVEQLLSAAWRLRRTGAAERQVHAYAAERDWDETRVRSDRGDDLPADRPRPPGVGETLLMCVASPADAGRALEALGRAEQRLLGTVLRCSRELRQLKVLRVREAGAGADDADDAGGGEGAGAGDAADGPNAVDAPDAGDEVDATESPPLAATRTGRAPIRGAASGDTASAAPATSTASTTPTAPAAPTAPAPPPQDPARPGVVAGNPAVGSFRTAGTAASPALPLFEPADATPREAAWCGAAAAAPSLGQPAVTS